MYRHFGSKDGLLRAVLERRSDRVPAWLAAAAAAAGDDPYDRLDAVFAALGGRHAEPAFRGCAILNAAAQRHEDPARTVAARHLDRRLALLSGIARDAGAADPVEAGRQLLMLVAGATALAGHHGDPATTATRPPRRPGHHGGGRARGAGGPASRGGALSGQAAEPPSTVRAVPVM